MKTIEVLIINAFVDAGEGGNPAGVVLDAERFTQDEKLQIAAQIGVSETAFVSPSNAADFKLEFFTPTKQIADCGHATVATFSYLAQQKLVTAQHSSKETIDGRREIRLKGDSVFMEQTAPKYKSLDETSITLADVLSSLSLNEDDLSKDAEEPLIVNTGVNYLVVGLKGESELRRIKPNFEAIEKISRELDLIGYYVFSLDTVDKERDAGARMFAPFYGIEEEAATGMAAGTLAAYLFDHFDLKKEKLVIEQGFYMNPPSPSEIRVELEIENGAVKSLLVGGQAKVSSRKQINLS
jgi:PhzF family phenazine biosynthesis protein